MVFAGPEQLARAVQPALSAGRLVNSDPGELVARALAILSEENVARRGGTTNFPA